MDIIVTKNAGFCYGVKRAVNIALNESKTKKVCTFGPLIHNNNFIKELKEKGIRIVNSINEIEKDETVILRSHGVTKETYEDLIKKNIPYIDATCHDVKKIHEIVEEYYFNGFVIMILGDKDHPEVIGTKSYTDNKALIFDDIADIKKDFFNNVNNYCIVAQTTFEVKKFKEIINEIKTICENIIIFNTICKSTQNRQKETFEISSKVDKMIVLGDKNSKNTMKLFEISKKNCEKSFLIDSISEIELNIFKYGDKIGISAGASTPPGIIEEAIKTMSDQNNNNELSFEELLEQSFVTLHTGDIVKGTVLRVSDGEVSVNLGYKSDGIISREELSDNPAFKASENFKIGDEIEVYVMKINDGEGNVSLSRKRIEAKKGMEDIEKAYESNEIVEGKVIEAVKGGLMALIKGIKVFVPSSQISNKFVEDLKSFLGQELNFKILEFDPAKRRIVAGRKELAQIEEDKKKTALFEKLELNSKITGTVRRIVDFGAFVDLGGIDGLIHISELSWGRVKKVKDVLKEGDIVEVTVIDFDKAKGKISLSLKDVKDNPWYNIEEKYPIGAIVSGKVARMVPFGVFVELEEGVDGLVHISHISSKHIAKPEDVLSIGEIINVKVTDINKENKRISLSKKDADEPSAEELSNVNVEDDENSETKLVYETPSEDVLKNEEIE